MNQRQQQHKAQAGAAPKQGYWEADSGRWAQATTARLVANSGPHFSLGLAMLGQERKDQGLTF